ncbi:eukaryotic translation initiation factor 5B [Drosophila subobscura]|uniref:eukaryotic translation initiation factor 5B n=1 Tax=Drosophila subobscura TaxID=7241 RepID=UPI00155A3E0E|nr:eukaryotic translation initiation factor 5B [Drosophila subobscura]
MELFDMVKAAPPPLRVRESPRNSRGASQLPGTPSPTPSTKAATTDTSAAASTAGTAAASASSSRHLEIFEDDLVEPCKRLRVRLKRTVSRELAEEKEPNGKDNDDDDNDCAVGDSLLHSFPPKTKAQQKSFADLPRIASSGQQLIKPVCVRVKRLTTAEIEKFTTAKGKYPATPMSGPRKRGRPKKLPNASDITDTSSPSPPKKPKVHIKVPLVPSGTKSRAHQHSPTKTKGRPSKSKKATTTTQRSQELINRYGTRFFRCYVKIKRTQMSQMQMQSQPKASGSGGPATSRVQKTLKSPNKGRPRKSNLTVSFSESVEILGSSPRRSALGMRLKRKGTPKPTRLQRVDATGNVLEDIALGTPTGRDRRRSSNGGASPSRKLKRSASSVPVMGLASLRLDDDQKPENENDDEDEEYIVPNELPRTKRDVTPVPKKRKKMSVTTTISDSDSEQVEMELPVQKEQKEHWGKEQKQLKKYQQIIQKVGKMMNKSSKLDEPLRKAEQTETKTNAATQKEEEKEQEQELEQTLAAKCNSSADKLIDQVGADAAKEVAVANEKEDKVEEQTDQDASNLTDQKEANADEKANEDSSHVEENVNSFKEKEKENEECSVLPVEIVPEADLGAEVEVESELVQEMRKAKEASKEEDHLLDLVDETLLDELVLEESEKEEQEQEQSHDKHDIDAIMDLGATLEVAGESKSAAVAAAVTSMLSNEDEEDILEIQASLEDVRQLHTPTSSPDRSGPTLPHPRATLRLDSGDSEASFKSMSAATDTSINQELVVTPPRTSAAAPSPTLPDELISTHNCNINSIDTTSRGGASPIPESYFSIEPERTSEDDDLGRLVEPDFSLSSSRHAISRGTLDDIMTALDS